MDDDLSKLLFVQAFKFRANILQEEASSIDTTVSSVFAVPSIRSIVAAIQNCCLPDARPELAPHSPLFNLSTIRA